ncbi:MULTISPECIES: CBS domain-containing protein [Anaerolinea]|uniref:CBS domain-containing protein n=1 Tax=Anaerolinea TaxID=233189 RepID=UPI002632F11D|nr:CBS domain-containing protein [Anaerolinea thermophila]
MSDNSNPQRILTDQDIQQITRAEELAYELKVEEVMSRDVQCLHPDMLMHDALELFRTKRISGAPVTCDSSLCGVVSMEDLIRCLLKQDLDARISDYMTPNPFFIHPQDPVIEALKLFVSTRHGRLPVVDQDRKVVGILTKGDITAGLLRALQKDFHAEELRRYRASHLFEDIVSDRTSLILRYQIKPRDFSHGGAASSNIKRALLRLGATPNIARRCGIAAYEAEMNLIIHTTNGGMIRVEIEPHQITIEASDDGPGIRDIDLAMQPGYSTASEEIRELGFGAGMGLVNIKRCVDQFRLESTWGKGTRLKVRIFMKPEESAA